MTIFNGFRSDNGSVVSEKPTVMMYWNDGIVDDDFACRITWWDNERDKFGILTRPCYPVTRYMAGLL
jgi:hypothetical protein